MLRIDGIVMGLLAGLFLAACGGQEAPVLPVAPTSDSAEISAKMPSPCEKRLARYAQTSLGSLEVAYVVGHPPFPLNARQQRFSATAWDSLKTGHAAYADSVGTTLRMQLVVNERLTLHGVAAMGLCFWQHVALVPGDTVEVVLSDKGGSKLLLRNSRMLLPLRSSVMKAEFVWDEAETGEMQVCFEEAGELKALIVGGDWVGQPVLDSARTRP